MKIIVVFADACVLDCKRAATRDTEMERFELTYYIEHADLYHIKAVYDKIFFLITLWMHVLRPCSMNP